MCLCGIAEITVTVMSAAMTGLELSVVEMGRNNKIPHKAVTTLTQHYTTVYSFHTVALHESII